MPRPDNLLVLLDAVNAALLHPPQPNEALLHGLVLLSAELGALRALKPADADDADADGGGGGPPLAAESEAFVPTVEWMAEWQARLPLEPISLVLDALLPQLQHLQDARADAVADAVAHALRATPLSDLLPPPPPVSVRRYQPNEFSYVWITQVLWGIVYSRNQHLYDARRVRLVQVVQVGQ